MVEPNRTATDETLTPPSAAAMGPPVPDELVEEILLRLPPSDPASLAHAALASKRWCRLATGPSFRRRYRALHRPPPLLGFLRDLSDGDGFSARFVSTSSFRPPRAGHRGLRPLDARHGRVLFLGADDHSGGGGAIDLLVWDPITDKMVELPRLPLHECPISWKAAVLCAVPAADCDHLGCHRGPFLVVLVITNRSAIRICVYSSEAAAWPAEASTYDFSFTIPGLFPFLECGRWDNLAQGRRPLVALVGNALYFMCGIRILIYDWYRQGYSIEHLALDPYILPPGPQELITMRDGRVALAAVAESTLYIVPRDGELGCGEIKTIAFENMTPVRTSLTATPHVVGFDEGNGFVFLRIGNEIFSLDIKSTQATRPARLKKVCEGPGIVPYINFCTPVMGVLCTDDGAKAGASSDGQSCLASGLFSQVGGFGDTEMRDDLETTRRRRPASLDDID